jgi:hypothetical protein
MHRQADLEGVVTDVPLVDAGGRPPDDGRHVVDAEGGQAEPVGLLGADRRDVAVGEEAAQLVLGRDRQDGDPGPPHLGVDRWGPQDRRVDELDLLAIGRAVVVAGHPVDRRRRAGHDREVVGVGERRHLGEPEVVGAAPGEHRAQARHQPTGHPIVEVGRLAAVDRDDDRRPIRQPIVAAVDGHELSGHRLRAS